MYDSQTPLRINIYKSFEETFGVKHWYIGKLKFKIISENGPSTNKFWACFTTLMNGRSTYKKVIDIGRDRGRETEKIVSCDKLLDFSLLDTWYDFDLTWHFKYLQSKKNNKMPVGQIIFPRDPDGRGLQQLKVSYS